MKDKVCIWLYFIGVITMGLFPWLISVLFPKLILVLFPNNYAWNGIVQFSVFVLIPYLYFPLASFFAAKRGQNTLFLPYLFGSVYFCICLIEDGPSSFYWLFLPLGYVGYFWGNWFRNNNSECK